MLTFNLKKQWFDKIKSGEKTHEKIARRRKRAGEDGYADRHHLAGGLLYGCQRARAVLHHHQPGGIERQGGPCLPG